MSIAATVGTGFDKLAAHFLLHHPEERLHVRALARHLDMSLGSLRRGLAKLEERGMVRRVDEGGQVYYEADLTNPAWGGIRILLREIGDPVTVVREALSSVRGVKAAMMYGSQAKGTARRTSDIDILVMSDTDAHRQLNRSLLAAESLLDREIDCRQVTTERLGKSSRYRDFVRRVAEGPRQYLVGTPGVFEEVAK
jgi:predicted nucleotidyltransferase